jgi:hypothetical protein
MTNQHPIIPPIIVMNKWRINSKTTYYDNLISAAQWGADQELEACCNDLVQFGLAKEARKLKFSRRPKTSRLKEQALTALHAVATGANDTREQLQDLETILKALEALND